MICLERPEGLPKDLSLCGNPVATEHRAKPSKPIKTPGRQSDIGPVCLPLRTLIGLQIRGLLQASVMLLKLPVLPIKYQPTKSSISRSLVGPNRSPKHDVSYHAPQPNMRFPGEKSCASLPSLFWTYIAVKPHKNCKAVFK